jgi:1,4-alpha-glucan branching enzyme
MTENGIHFRVWALNAEAVYLTGSFNNFDEQAFPLQNEGNGYGPV